MGLILIIIIVLAVFAIQWLRSHPQAVAAWITRRLVRRMQKQAARSAGPGATSRTSTSASSGSRRSRQKSSGRNHPIIPPEYAEDVEFTEVRDFSASSRTYTDSGHVYSESQVSDVEWEEVKIKSGK